MIETILTVGAAILVLAITTATLFWLTVRFRRRLDFYGPYGIHLEQLRFETERALYETRRAQDAVGSRTPRLAGAQPPRTMEEIIEDKKQRILSIPNVTFSYRDEPQLRNFYNDYFQEPTVENLISKLTTEASGQVTATFPKLLESRLQGKDLREWIGTIKLPDTSLNGMFVRYQRETIKSKQVALGLEEVDIELTDLDSFDQLVKQLATEFDLQLTEGLLGPRRAQLKRKAADRTLGKLEQATGWVLVEGKFQIARQDDLFRCTYVHPVNEYLPNEIGPVQITSMVADNALEPALRGNWHGSVGRAVPLKIYGRVWQPLDVKGRVWDLQITPLAIY